MLTTWNPPRCYFGTILEKYETHYRTSIKYSLLFCIAGLAFTGKDLTLSRWRSLSYRNQSIDLKTKSMDWFLYDKVLRHERVNMLLPISFMLSSQETIWSLKICELYQKASQNIPIIVLTCTYNN